MPASEQVGLQSIALVPGLAQEADEIGLAIHEPTGGGQRAFRRHVPLVGVALLFIDPAAALDPHVHAGQLAGRNRPEGLQPGQFAVRREGARSEAAFLSPTR